MGTNRNDICVFNLHLLSIYDLYVYYDDTDIVLLLLQMLVRLGALQLGW